MVSSIHCGLVCRRRRLSLAVRLGADQDEAGWIEPRTPLSRRQPDRFLDRRGMEPLLPPVHGAPAHPGAVEPVVDLQTVRRAAVHLPPDIRNLKPVLGEVAGLELGR